MKYVRWGIAAIAVGLSGCVRPGAIDPGVIARYQRQMAGESPTQRLGPANEVGLLRPAPRKGVVPLKVEEVKDDSGKVVKRVVRLSLKDAIMRALANSPEIQVISFDPAISREEMTSAAAAFDVVVFGGYSHAKSHEASDIFYRANRSDSRSLELGVRQLLPTGAQWAVTWDHKRSWDSAGLGVFPTEFEPSVALEITQPLLRGGWFDFNLGRLRIARLGHKSSLASFRELVEQTVGAVHLAYWQLQQARREVAIQENLLAKTQETYNRVLERAKGGLDAHKVHIKQAESAAASRRADLIRAKKRIADARDRLGLLLADPQINVLGEYEIVPTTAMSDIRVRVDAADQLAAALRHSPVLEQARLAIRLAAIEIKVARSQTLPRLDVTASRTSQGLHGLRGQAYKMLRHDRFSSYTLGLEFEYPIGNRGPRAELRRARLVKRQAVARFQGTADQVAVVVRERVRQVGMVWAELQQQRAAVAAGKMELEALEDTERIRGVLSPEFLQLKLSAQERLAAAERAELQALVDYNSAMVELRQVTGTLLDLPDVKVLLPAAE